LEKAKAFYLQTLDLHISDEQVGHHGKFDRGAGFICLECKGAESYHSKDKAVLFFETPCLSEVLAIGKENLFHAKNNWAVLHDPEGHSIVIKGAKAGRGIIFFKGIRLGDHDLVAANCLTTEGEMHHDDHIMHHDRKLSSTHPGSFL
jgi:hypothetical protein